MAKGECSCWMPYPNELCRKNNGSWKCVDKYENIKPLTHPFKPGGKTKCRKKDIADK